MTGRTLRILIAFLALACLAELANAMPDTSLLADDEATLCGILGDPVAQRMEVDLVMAAAYALSDSDTDQAIAALLDNIGYPAAVKPLNGKECPLGPPFSIAGSHTAPYRKMTINALPVAQALARVGGPAVPAILRKIGSTDNYLELSGCITALEAITGMTEAEALLRQELSRAPDSATAKRLDSGLKCLPRVLSVSVMPPDLNEQAVAKAREVLSTRLQGAIAAMVVVNGSVSLGKTVESHGQLLTSAKRLAELLHLGARINGPEVTLSRGGSTTRVLAFRSGSTAATEGGKRVSLPVAPMARDGDILVPLRTVTDFFGVTMRWDSETRIASVK